MKVGDLVVSKPGLWHTPKLVVEIHAAAKAMVGVLFDDGVRWVHYKHLEVISESR